MLRIALFVALGVSRLGAQGGEQRFASLGDFQLESGEVIRDCKIGYRTYGRLDERKANGVLFPTWFGGTTAQLADNFGPGKMVDTGKYYVIAVDALGNGVSASPSNSKSQPRLKFPRFSIRDMVESQHRLLTGILQIGHLRAVMGISMGGMQTFQWMVQYPGFMDRAIPIVGTPRLTPYDVLLWEAETHAIENDVNWNNGEYSGRPGAAMRAVADIHSLAISTPAHYVRENASRDMVEVLTAGETRQMETVDTNDYYRQLQAMLGHDIFRLFGGDKARAAGAVKAKVTVVVATQDHMVNPGPGTDMARLLKAGLVELSSECGHLSPGCEAPKVSAAVAEALR